MNAAARVRSALHALGATPTSASAYALLVGLLATVVAKILLVARSGPAQGTVLEALGACAADLVVYPALTLLLAAGERVRPWLRYLTAPLTVLAAALAIVNAAYLSIANDQIDARILAVGLARIDEVMGIVMLEAVGRAGTLGPFLLLGLPLAYWGIRQAWRRAGVDDARLATLRIRGLSGLLASGVVLLVAARAAGRPASFVASLNEDNALVQTYLTWLESTLAPPARYEGAMEAHFGAPLVPPGAPQSLAEHEVPPSVLLLVLESTRFDHVELPVKGHASHAQTPHLKALAERGSFFTNAHAAMPHTSKSLVSILCGRLPAMENPIIEAADGVTRHCLPRRLFEAGYATAFFQSAIGSFELRPRLTVQLGYGTFEAFETLDAAPLGYLAGDDRALPVALAGWLDTLQQGRPFFATLLTSGTHHPYEVPADVSLEDPQDARARYAALVEIEDRVVGAALQALAERGRLDNTVIVALADHGEGLPGDPVLQHDNNFVDQGLHVPVILAGPGVPVRHHDGLMSLLDVAPTLLRVLDVESALPDAQLAYGKQPGRDLAPLRTVAPFACWNDGMCEGYLQDDSKLVDVKSTGQRIAFERRLGHEQVREQGPSDAELELLDEVHRTFLGTHLSTAPNLSAHPLRLPSGFVCGPGASPCVHPSRPKGGFH